MLLSVDTLSNPELQSLRDLNLSTGLIAIHTANQDSPKFDTIPKSEVTCWQLFLRAFGRGNLATTQIYLSEIVPALNRFDWTLAAEIDNRIYLNICRLAYKAFNSKGDETLLNSVASSTVDKTMHYTLSRNGVQEAAHDATMNFKLNPLTRFKHIQAVIEANFKPTWNMETHTTHHSVQIPSIEVTIQHDGKNVDPEAFVTSMDLKDVQIFIQTSKTDINIKRETEKPAPPPPQDPPTKESTGYGGTKRR